MMSKFDFSVFRQPRPVLIKKMILAFLGDVLIGMGIGLNSCAGLGNDPISVLSDGLHKFFGISMGAAVNATAYTLLVVVLIFGRKYINIGTLINVLPLGFFVNLGVATYSALNVEAGGLIFRSIAVLVACAFLFLELRSSSQWTSGRTHGRALRCCCGTKPARSIGSYGRRWT